MKRIVYFLFLIISFFVFTEKLDAQLSTQGTDFWLSFGQNRTFDHIYVNLQLRIVTETDNVNVKLTYKDGNVVENITIVNAGVWTHAFNNTEKNRIFTRGNVNTNSSNNKSLHIESDQPIYVYALNQANITTDATNVLPVTCLGTDYYHISYKATSSYREGYTIVATEDTTTIYENNAQLAIINKGQAYHHYWPTSSIPSSNKDQTGLHITSDKPIAYFTTNSGVYIYSGLTNGADCLFQQLMPVNTWGTQFMVPVTHRGFVRLRVLASQNNTTIAHLGGVIKTDNGGYSGSSLNLNAGQFVELQANIDHITPEYGCFISSDKPVAVCTYLVGRDAVDSVDDVPSDEKGDPSMTWVPPIEQAVIRSRVAPFIPTGLTELEEHYALIVVPTANKNLTTVAINSGAPTPLSGGTWYDHTSAGYSFYSYHFDDNDPTKSYLLENPSGLTVLAYAFGRYESYYYLSAAASRKLDLAFYKDNIHHQDLDGMAFCDTTAHFDARIQYAVDSVPGYLKWYVDDVEQTAVRDTVEWDTVMTPGVHTVKMVVLGIGYSDSVSSTFTISLPTRDTITDTICLGDKYNENGFDTIPTTDFLIDSLNLTNHYGCDSVVILHLTVAPRYRDTIFDTICLGGRYTYTNNSDTIFDTVPQSPVLLTDSVNIPTAIYQCDSIIILKLTVLPVYDTLIIDTICFGKDYTNTTYPFLDTTPTDPGSVIIDTTLLTDTGSCDSIVRLRLMVLPVYDTIIYDTICFGKSYTNTIYPLLDTIPTSLSPVIIDTTLHTVTGSCDSIVRLRLEVLPVYDTIIYDTICFGKSYTNTTYPLLDTIPTSLSPVIIDTTLHTVTGGCDSIVRLRLEVLQIYNDTIPDTICLNDTYNNYNFIKTPTSIGTHYYTDSLQT
ncbi:MAG: IgGFc-binding protein, partial [Prevotellaceae bacterium]|nr:IgGFc-binding protein [Prevotellaceae bacterium]